MLLYPKEPGSVLEKKEEAKMNPGQAWRGRQSQKDCQSFRLLGPRVLKGIWDKKVAMVKVDSIINGTKIWRQNPTLQ